MPASTAFTVRRSSSIFCWHSIRTTILISVFGLVRTEAERFKEALYLDVGLIGTEGVHDQETLHLVRNFLPLWNDVYIQAGPYINLSHGFLSSFYGVLVTYIAILYQTIVMGT